MPISLTPIGKVICGHLHMAVLCNPNEKTAVVYYVYYRTIERRPSGLANGPFFKVAGNLEGIFSEYCTVVLNKHFE